MVESIDDRVLFGVKLLDRLRPGWAAEIDLDSLSLYACDRCVLGQLYGRFDRGLKTLGIVGPSSYYGFIGNYQEIVSLDRDWRRVIRERTGTEEPTP